MIPKSVQAESPSRSWRGGARIDLQNATYPFATLTVSTGHLELRVAQMAYRFRPDEVRAIEVVRAIPFFGKGVRIHHATAGCPQLILFWTMGNPETLAGVLREYGYGTEPQAEFERTTFPAERTTCLVMVIMLSLFLLLPGFCIVSALLRLFTD